ncbi:Sensor protein KdpD [Anatilimnocola aggregata]|uniref:histidine kinase n=1 Tax=Anatilimnocola aggregata TaxID=2528021 RepID=A0A517Y925_9BACT|nr:sensor histidine kinase KdpD [Anatilimnocola aggregata]QDU26739.1 Sensor protein KdpD [Anatilimnocola aggregata]
MTDARPDPDMLLSRVESELAKEHRGQLRIFFGYAAGVGKTYAMLQAAQRRKAAGVDVVVGYVEPHGRKETELLLAGLEALPFREVPYRDLKLREFDLDAALVRKPQLILVDELAHTNAEGLRHAKRWQDVEELLAADIDVYTTVNVQHIESLNDVIAQITGIEVHETVPDDVFDRADEIELIDITPEQLVERLRAGKVYLPEQAQRAIQSFFQRANLVALREISLRRSADRVGADVQTERNIRGERKTWPTTDRLLVCVSPSPQSAKLIRTARRMASALHADWIAVHVETAQDLPTKAQHQLVNNLRLAEQLGAETVTLTGNNAADEIVTYARDRNVTKIIAGKTDFPRWHSFLFGSFLDSLLRLSGDIDVYVIRGMGEAPTVKAPPPTRSFNWQPYGWATLIVAICTALGAGMYWLQFAEANIAMILLLGVVLSAAWFGRWPGIYASVVSVLVFDFCFVPPRWTFAVSDAQYLITFSVMLGISVGISALTAQIRGQVLTARQQQRRAETLYRLSKQLAAVSGSDFLVTLAAAQVGELFHGEVAVYLHDQHRELQLRVGQNTELARHANSLGVAQWVVANDQPAGAGTETLPQTGGIFVPLIGTQSTLGVLAVRPQDQDLLQLPGQRQMLEACAGQLALALERDQLSLEASQVLLQAETERLRSSLLSSVSHDLRTPLSCIAGASSTLLQSTSPTEHSRRELLQSIYDESHRMSRLVDNLLEMTKIEAAGLQVHRQWEVVEEIIGAALHRLDSALAARTITTSVPPELPMIEMDGLLIEQVLVNLLDNAIKYTPPDSPLEINVSHSAGWLSISVADHGVGIAAGDERLIFEKFYRAGSPDSRAQQRGSGLGLAICKAIVETHGGEIHAHNRPGGGACFTFTLPASKEPPTASESKSPQAAGLV